jgi:Putative MetA-pathway of phenol degradation
MRKLLLAILFICACDAGIAKAQNGCSNTSRAETLYCMPILAVENLHSVPTTGTVSAGIPPGFSALSAGLGSQVGDVPTPSPASGFLYSVGSGGLSGVKDLGPIFSEPSATVGRHKFYLEFTYQHFEFDQIDAVPLRQIPLQISSRECGVQSPPPGCSAFIETQSRLDLRMNQFTSYATFGLTSSVDVSVVLPILSVAMGMQSRCSVCFQQQPSGSVLVFTPSTATGSASGIGDVSFRVKAAVLRGERAGLAVGVDVRTPTGDEQNFLGSGAVGVRPFAAFGYRTRHVTSHANIGYQANGDSVLASLDGNTPRQLPNSLTYNVGIDLRFVRHISVTGDLLGQTFFDAERVLLGVRAPLNHPDIARTTDTLNTKSFAAGLKINPVGNLLIIVNVLVKLDDAGLQYKPAPMVGISYTF